MTQRGVGDVMTEDEAVITERAAELGWEFAEGAQYTTAEVAARYGITKRGARMLLNRISRKIKIYSQDGKWKRLANLQ